MPPVSLIAQASSRAGKLQVVMMLRDAEGLHQRLTEPVHAGGQATDRHGGERARHCPPPGCPWGGPACSGRLALPAALSGHPVGNDDRAVALPDAIYHPTVIGTDVVAPAAAAEPGGRVASALLWRAEAPPGGPTAAASVISATPAAATAGLGPPPGWGCPARAPSPR